ncbi:hypothetical protein BDF14DRAFT_1794505 [Spinellus fusiger]|nr:hypothetical protein BDF14DRAFT_1794505 [Spinellus fusiger]
MLTLDYERTYIVCHQLLFLLTGLCTTLGIQWLFYKGAATGDSCFAQVIQYLGMVLVGLLIPSMRNKRRKAYAPIPMPDEQEGESIQMNALDSSPAVDVFEGPIHHRSIIQLVILDVVANFCVTVGFSIVGSGMYQVIYSSVVIWCAILSYVFMGRTLRKLQWLAIFGVSLGLAVSSLGNHGKDTQGTSLLMLGTLLTLGGTFFYSCVYVYSDYILSRQIPPPLPAAVCCYTGMYATITSLVWISVYTLPRYDKLIHIDPTLPISYVWGMYALVMVANGTHAWNYYELIDKTGSVATGILQGLRAVLVYGISHAWYCSTDSTQCFTTYKGIGSLLVISCVLLFTVGSKPKEHQK